MKKKAQSGLEYLITYGWALVLIAAIIGVLVFAALPQDKPAFNNSGDTRILLKGAVLSGGSATIALQNISGGEIKIVELIPGDFYNCTINGGTQPELAVGPGGEIIVECTAVEGSSGSILIKYKDHAGLLQNTTVSSNKKTAVSSSQITACNTTITEPGNYVLANDIGPCTGWGIAINSDDVSLNCQGKTINATTGVQAFGVNGVTISNCVISGTVAYTGIYTDNFSDSTITNNTFEGENLAYGIGMENSFDNTISGNTVTQCDSTGISLVNAHRIELTGNRVEGGTYCTGMHMWANSSDNTVNNNVLCNNRLENDIQCLSSLGNTGTGNTIGDGGQFCTGIYAGACPS